MQACLTAGSIMDLSFFPPPDVSCQSTLSVGANSETLTLGACSGASFPGQLYLTATAEPFMVAVDGVTPQFNDFESFLAVSASAEFDGGVRHKSGATRSPSTKQRDPERTWYAMQSGCLRNASSP